MNEKRKEHRLRATMPIKIIDDSGQAVLGRTENISRLGTYVESPKEIPSGQTVDIVLELPAYTQDTSLIGEVRCEGTVFRSSLIRESEGRKLFGLGIFFTDFAGSSDKDKVSSYVDHLIVTEEQEIKEGLKRRKERRAVQHDVRQTEGLIARQEEFQKEALELLKQIASRLEKLTATLNARKK
jgi:hypothetical protein